jgi:benzoyl-CoA reductase/2-hydroxyglutaryl-CoA dehydratase subunit BcrC/BadD/HgdB
MALTREIKETSIKRYKEERDWFKLNLEAAELLGTEEGELSARLLRILLEAKERVVDAVENDKPFIGGYYCNAPEIFTAMDLPWFMVLETPFLAASAPYIIQDIDASEEMGLTSDLCTAIRLPVYYIENNMMPIPTCCLGLLYPCDGANMLHQVLMHNSNWRQVPIYSCDPPYASDERAVSYFAEELREMTGFIEEHTGRKLEMDKLVEVCERSNQVYAMWQEYMEMRKNIPCPHGWEMGGAQCFAISQCFDVGNPKSVAWFEQLMKVGEDRVRKGLGAQTKEGWKENVRLLWFDIMPYGWIFEFMPWLEEELGAVIVNDMFGNYPYTLIDTSSQETIYYDLAKRNLVDAPMVRQARGIADNFSIDIRRMVKDFRIDAVIWPGHMGHKDGAATVGIMRETCRDLRVPFLHIGLDLFDKRYTSIEEVKDRVATFLRTHGFV